MSGKAPAGHVEWLYEQLPALVAGGIVSAESAERLRAHYGPVERRSAANVAVVGISILGAAFIIGGVILLLASNWEQLSRGVRTVIAFTPLAIAQGVVVYTLLRQRESAAWREGSAVFLTGAIGASIALIGQTYHLPGQLDSFLFTWMVLAWPLIYLLDSSAVALLAMGGALAWGGETMDPAKPVYAWVFLAGLLPHLVLLARRNARTVRFQMLSWFFVPFLIVLPPVFDHLFLDTLWTLTYASLFVVLLYFGLSSAAGPALNPYRLLGGLGIAVLSIILTFDEVWDEPGQEFIWRTMQENPMGAASYSIGLAVAALAFAVLAMRRTTPTSPAGWLWLAFFPVSLIATLAIFTGAGREFPAIIFNLYTFALAIVTLREGITRGGLGLANIGMGMIAILAMVRFFDLDLPFLFRGLAFIAIGVAFLSANVYMARRMRRGEARS